MGLYQIEIYCKLTLFFFTDYVEIQLRKGAQETRKRANGAETGETAGEDRNCRVDEMEQ